MSIAYDNPIRNKKIIEKKNKTKQNTVTGTMLKCWLSCNKWIASMLVEPFLTLHNIWRTEMC